MKAPRKSDYDVEVIEASVHVTFKPTDSHYTYLRLADPADVAREGPLSRSPKVRHANTGDIVGYDEREVEAMAFSLASAAVGGH